MESYQDKVLGEFERVAKQYACKPTIETKYANTGRVVAHRGWQPVAYLDYDFQSGSKNTIRFNGAPLGPGPSSVRWSSDDAEDLEAAFDYWRDMLYEDYECDECGDHHRPGAKHSMTHTYLTPSPALVAQHEGLDPRECGECGQVHEDAQPGDTIVESYV